MVGLRSCCLLALAVALRYSKERFDAAPRPLSRERTGRTMAHFDPTTLEEKKPTAVSGRAGGLSPTHSSTLLNALTQFEPSIVQAWVQEELLQEWVQQGRQVGETLGARGKRSPWPCSPPPLSFYRYYPGWRCSNGSVFCWILKLSAAQPIVTRFPDGLTALDRAERISVYRLGRSAVYHSREAAAAFIMPCPTPWSIFQSRCGTCCCVASNRWRPLTRNRCRP